MKYESFEWIKNENSKQFEGLEIWFNVLFEILKYEIEYWI